MLIRQDRERYVCVKKQKKEDDSDHKGFSLHLPTMLKSSIQLMQEGAFQLLSWWYWYWLGDDNSMASRLTFPYNIAREFGEAYTSGYIPARVPTLALTPESCTTLHYDSSPFLHTPSPPYLSPDIGADTGILWGDSPLSGDDRSLHEEELLHICLKLCDVNVIMFSEQDCWLEDEKASRNQSG